MRVLEVITAGAASPASGTSGDARGEGQLGGVSRNSRRFILFSLDE
jgi:hypothetical protein